MKRLPPDVEYRALVMRLVFIRVRIGVGESIQKIDVKGVENRMLVPSAKKSDSESSKSVVLKNIVMQRHRKSSQDYLSTGFTWQVQEPFTVF
jgi:hypothetical protein